MIVARYELPYQAHLTRAMLEGEGVPAVVENEQSFPLTPFWNDKAAGVKLKVRAEDEERARRIIGDIDEG